jgi:RecJ-like exonuclease
MKPCDNCDGAGKMPDGEKCPKCDGTGKIADDKEDGNDAA